MPKHFDLFDHKIALLSYLLIWGTACQAQNEEGHLDINTNKQQVALQGYDAVSYFEASGPLKGDKVYTAQYDGATYWFTGQEHLDTFLKNPTAYIPQYGGWCAYAIGKNSEKVRVDPKTFKVTDGKLYLFYNFNFNNTLKDWNKKEKELTIKANENWKRIIK